MLLADPLAGPLFLAGLTAAGLWDIARRRVPNVLNFGFAAVGLAFHLYRGGWEGLAFGALGYAVALFCVFLPFLLRLYRGGDAKLVMAIGAWLGPRPVIAAFLYGAVLGGVLGIVVALRHRRQMTLPAADRPDSAHVPMAVAFALGGVAALLWPLDP